MFFKENKIIDMDSITDYKDIKETAGFLIKQATAR
jgi:hypothetical protein